VTSSHFNMRVSRAKRKKWAKKIQREAEAQAAATSVVSPDEPDEPSTPDQTLELGDPGTQNADADDDTEADELDKVGHVGYATDLFTDNGEAWWEPEVHIDDDLWTNEAGNVHYGLDSVEFVLYQQRLRDMQRRYDGYWAAFWAVKELEEPVDHDEYWDEEAAMSAINLDFDAPEDPRYENHPSWPSHEPHVHTRGSYPLSETAA